jgi:hypothetical protein
MLKMHEGTALRTLLEEVQADQQFSLNEAEEEIVRDIIDFIEDVEASQAAEDPRAQSG